MNYIYTRTNAFVKRLFGSIRTFPFVYIFLNVTVDHIFWQVWEGASEDWQRFSTTESRLLSMDARPPEKTTKKLLKTTIVILTNKFLSYLYSQTLPSEDLPQVYLRGSHQFEVKL